MVNPGYFGSESDHNSENEETETKTDTEPEKGGEDGIAGALERLKLGAKKKLVVLSLNGLLIHRAHRYNPSQIPRNRTHDGLYNRNRLVYKRPYVDEFMRFCLDKFEVGLWSSSQEHNIDGVLDCVFKEEVKSKLRFIWDQDECTDTGFKTLENKEKPVFLKDLSKANTAIFPEIYDPNNASDDALDPAKELCKYLEGVAEAEDVPSYVKEHTFGQPAVGPEHPDWDFYSQVLSGIKENQKN